MAHARIRPCNANHHGKPATRGAFMVNRITSDRRFFLRPSETVNNVIDGCIRATAEKCEAKVRAISMLSTHIHTELTIDPDNLSDFNAWVHRHSAQCLIEHYGSLYPKRTREAVWSKAPPHELILANENAILEKTVYLLANAVAALPVTHYKKMARPTLHAPRLGMRNGTLQGVQTPQPLLLRNWTRAR